MKTRILNLIEAASDGITSAELAASLGAPQRSIRLALAELKSAGTIGSTGTYRDGAAIITSRDAPQQLELVPVATGKRPAQREREIFGHEFKREA